MSTTCLLYLGLGVAECNRTEYVNGEILLHVCHPRNRVRCLECHRSNIIHRGTVIRKLQVLLIGKKACSICW